MPKVDLRIYKREIREEMRAIRRQMPPEVTKKKNERIFQKVISLWEYRQAKVLVVYVSKELEVDTWKLMEHAFSQGKQVAVPRCVPNSRQMEMHLITSVDELSKGSYGIMEPSAQAPVLSDTSGAIAIVPAFCNDLQGYRVGYGGGYYDRYLSRFQGSKVGVNYSDCVRRRLIGGRYDVPIDILVTDRSIIRIRRPAPAPRGRGPAPWNQERKAD